MNDLPEQLFEDPVWTALQTTHRHLAVCAGNACRYPADIAPFAAIRPKGAAAMAKLKTLLELGESVVLIGNNYAPCEGLSSMPGPECWQMLLSAEVRPPEQERTDVVRLSSANETEMLALTEVASPGFFRRKGYEMGRFYGIRSGNELVAMGGERWAINNHREISGVCTHPAHRGKGMARDLIWHLIRTHRREHLVSWIHVDITNQPALDLYLQIGFKVVRKIALTRITRNG